MRKITDYIDLTAHDKERHTVLKDVPSHTPQWYDAWKPAGYCPVCGAKAEHEERLVEVEDTMAPFVRSKSETDKKI